MKRLVSEDDTERVVDYLIDGIYNDRGDVIKNGLEVDKLEMWEIAKKKLKLAQSANVLKEYYSNVILPEFARWNCGFAMKCDLVQALGIPVESLIEVCELREKIEVDQKVSIDPKKMMIWKFLFVQLRGSIDGKEAKIRWANVSEREKGLDSFETSSAQLHEMPFPLDVKLFLMQKLKINIDVGFLIEARKHASVEVDIDGFISNFRIIDSAVGEMDESETAKADNRPNITNLLKRKESHEDEQRVNDQLQNVTDVDDDSMENSDAEIVAPVPLPSNNTRKTLPIRQCRVKQELINYGYDKPVENDSDSGPPPEEMSNEKFTPREDKNMWKFINKKIRSLKTGRPEKGLFRPNRDAWKEFKAKTNSEKDLKSLCDRYRKKFQIYEAPFSTRTKLEMYYALQIPVPDQYLIIVNRRFNLKLDSKKRIKNYESDIWAECSKTDDEDSDVSPEDPDNDVDSEDEGDFKPNFTWSETFEMWEYIRDVVRKERAIVGKTQKLKLTPAETSFWNNFEKHIKPDRSLDVLVGHYHPNMSRKVSSAPFDLETKANLFYALHLPVSWDFDQEFQKAAFIRFEDTDREEAFILDYCYKDRSVIRSAWSDLWLKDEEETSQLVRNMEKSVADLDPTDETLFEQ